MLTRRHPFQRSLVLGKVPLLLLFVACGGTPDQPEETAMDDTALSDVNTWQTRYFEGDVPIGLYWQQPTALREKNCSGLDECNQSWLVSAVQWPSLDQGTDIGSNYIPWTSSFSRAPDQRLLFAFQAEEEDEYSRFHTIKFGWIDRNIFEFAKSDYPTFPTQYVKNPYYNAFRPYGSPVITADQDGIIYLAFGVADEQDPSKARIQVSRCTSISDCAHEFVQTPDATQANYSIASVGTTAVLAVQRKSEPGQIRLYERETSGLSEIETLTHTDLGSVKPTLLHELGRTILLLRGESSSRLLERVGGAWETITTFGSLSVPEMEIRVTAAHGLVVYAASPSISENGRLYRIYRESENFTPLHAFYRFEKLGIGLTSEGTLRGPSVIYAPSTPGRIKEVALRDTHWADSTDVGAGSLWDRDPCFRQLPLNEKQVSTDGTATYSGALTGTIEVPVGTTAVIAPGSCLVGAHINVQGNLRFEGNEDFPIHMVSSSVKASRGGLTTELAMQWTFVEDSDVLITTDGPDPSKTKPRTSRFEHVTWTRRYQADESIIRFKEAALSIHPFDAYGWGNTQVRIPDAVIVESSLFYNVATDGIAASDWVSLRVANTRFGNIAGKAIAAKHAVASDLSLSIENVKIEDSGRGLDVSVDADKYQSLRKHAVDITDTLAAIDVDGLSITGASSPSEAGAFLEAVSGTILRSTIAAGAYDGLSLRNAGMFVVEESNIENNARHGIVLDVDIPPGLGKCAPTASTGSTTSNYFFVFDWAWADPLIKNSSVMGNDGVGIEIMYTPIPTLIEGSTIYGNGEEGVVFRHGRGLSAEGFNGECHTVAEEVDLPLSDLTHIWDSALSGNGSKTGGVELRSDHRLGTLDASNCYWGTALESEAKAKIDCVGSCSIAPIKVQ